MNSEGEEDWTIPIPYYLKDYLLNISSKLHQLYKSSAIIESTILAAPCKAEIIPFLDQKIDIYTAQRIENDASVQMQQIRAAYGQLKNQFNDQLSSLGEDLQIIYRYNRQISDFRAEYEYFRREIQQLRRQTEEIELRSKANLAEYRKEQDNIGQTFTQLTSEVKSMTGGVGQLASAQTGLDKDVYQLKDDLLQKYTETLYQTTYSRDLLYNLLHNVPNTLQEARAQIEQDMRYLIAQERQRRCVEQNYFKGVMNDIQERLSGVKQDQTSVKEQFDSTGREILAHCDVELDLLRHDISYQLQELVSKASAMRVNIDDAVKEQAEQISKLRYFEQTFRQADRQWKASVQEVSANTSKYVRQLETRIYEGVNVVREMLIQATSASKEAAEKSAEVRAVWEGDWRKREGSVDDYLIYLTRIAEDVKAAVDGETSIRTAEAEQLQRRVQEIALQLQKEIAKKANRADVEKALWLKVDRQPTVNSE